MQTRVQGEVALEAIQRSRTIAPIFNTMTQMEAAGDPEAVFDDRGFEVQANREGKMTKLRASIGRFVAERDFF